MKKAFAIVLMTAAGLVVSGQAAADEALATKKNCLQACHAIDTKKVGPAYKDVAAKYKASDIPMLVDKVMNGGSGVWGPIPMSANKTAVKLTKEEAEILVKWILAQKK